MDLTDGMFLRREFGRLNERLESIEAKADAIAAALDASAPVPEVEPIVRDLLLGGFRLQAVKAYQQSAGVDLATAEAFIERWGDRIADAYREPKP